jgi:hypothetical protein
VADIEQVWESQDTLIRNFGFHHYVHQDFDMQPDLTNAFDYILSIRVPLAQIGGCIVNPLKNVDPLPIKLLGGYFKPAGTIDGKLDDFQAYKADGTKGKWTDPGLADVRFLITLRIDITVPIFGKLKVDVSRKPCTIPLFWDAATKRYVKAKIDATEFKRALETSLI